MPRMPDFEAEIKRDFRWFGEHAEHILHIGDDVQPVVARERVIGVDPYATQAPAAAAATVEAAPAAQPPEEPMSLLDTIKADIAKAEAAIGALDEEALGKLNAVMAHPEASVVLNDLAGLAGVVGLPPGVITGAAGALKTVLSLYPAETAPAAPAEPAPAA